MPSDTERVCAALIAIKNKHPEMWVNQIIGRAGRSHEGKYFSPVFYKDKELADMLEWYINNMKEYDLAPDEEPLDDEDDDE
jgi:hypothetical protein